MIARRTLLLMAPLAVAACARQTPRVAFREPGYAELGQILLAVSTIETVKRYQPPLAPPHVDHLMPVMPERAVERWANDRLVAAGGPHRARFLIEDARVVETDLKTTPGLRGAFTNDQAFRYDGTIQATLEILPDRVAPREAFASATVTRRQSLAENASLNDRDRIWFQMVEAMMTDFNAEMSRQIRGNLTAYLR